MARFTAQHTTVIALDLSGACSIELGPGPGTVSISNLMERNREAITVHDRGANDGRVYGDEVEQEVSITVHLPNRELVSSSAARALNMVLKKGTFAAAQTTDKGGQVYALKLRVKLEDEAGNVDWIELPSVRFAGEFSVDADNTALTITGTNNVAPKIGTSEVWS